MHDMWTIAIGDPGRLSVCPSHGFAVQRKAARIEVLLGVETLGVPRYTALDADSMRPLQYNFGHIVK